MKIKKYSDQQNDSLAGKLLSYAGMSGAFLAAAAPADGQIVYTDVNPDTVIMGATYQIDIDNNAMPDYNLQQFGIAGQNVGAKFSAPVSNVSNEFMGSVGAYGYYYPSKLSAGAPINSAANFLSVAGAPGYEPSLVFAYATGNSYGNWSGQSGYVGIHFFSGGNDYYGWVELEVAPGGLSITLKSYAYESTPGMGIIAGDTATVIGIDQPGGAAAFDAGRITPNPSVNGRARLSVEADRSKELLVEVYNGMGMVVATEKRHVHAGKNLLQLNFPTLSNGAYFVKLSDESAGIFRKLVIAH
jgi:hypothetical protein